MKNLFLSHAPHFVHQDFAIALGAEIKKIPFSSQIINIIKKLPGAAPFYLAYSFLYGLLFTSANYGTVISDGGSACWAALALKIKNKKIKLVYLDADPMFWRAGRVKKLSNLPIKFLAKQMDFAISVSQQNNGLIKKFINCQSAVANPYPKEFKKNGIKKQNWGLYAGRLDPDKNIKRVIAFAQQCPYVERFFIAGDGTLLPYVKKICESNKKIIYMGNLGDADLQTTYNSCKFLVHLPDFDPHPCATMEAALCGCFPIISSGTGTKYLFNGAFIIKNPDDFSEINMAMEKILRDEAFYVKILNDSIKSFPTREKTLLMLKNIKI